MSFAIQVLIGCFGNYLGTYKEEIQQYKERRHEYSTLSELKYNKVFVPSFFGTRRQRGLAHMQRTNSICGHMAATPYPGAPVGF